MQPLGEDVSEQLARVAAAFKVIRTIRRKAVCSCGHHVSQPPMPACQSRAASPIRACWPTSSSRNTLITLRCTGSRRLPRATA
ncbi:IS66 family transposase zinc-finger binding domain-containing protein [Burkholderia latens]|uniref:IS66 family transposase zinc-finger binding domain-containing protein n=1 Tax=Burkholderia latens TaxID=488446 RepID=UPI001FC85F53|nr:IS66 family transposase zinc-finger binding domain-containing protein [Burkholderia latens]